MYPNLKTVYSISTGQPLIPSGGDGCRVGKEEWNDRNLINGDWCSYQR